MSKENNKGIFILILSSFFYSILPVFMRFIESQSIPPITQTLGTYFFSFIFISILFKIKKEKLNISKENILKTLILGIAYGLTNIFFVLTVLKTELGTALFLFYFYSILTPILAVLILNEKINIFNIIGILLVFTALFLLFQPNSFLSWKVGAVFAILSGICNSFFVIVRRSMKEQSGEKILFSSMFIGILIAIMGIFLFERDFTLSIPNLNLITIFAIFLRGMFSFLGWYTITLGFRYTKTSLGSIVVLIENVFVLIWAFLFFSEIPTIYTLLGGILIIFANIIVFLKGDNS